MTNDEICAKVWPNRERILVVADEVDDFLDRDKLVFNICSNKNNAFDRPVPFVNTRLEFPFYHPV